MFKIKTIRFIFFLWILLLSCKDRKKPEEKQNILSKTEMAEVLFDIHLSEAGIGLSFLGQDSFDYYLRNYYSAVFSKHQIDQEMFIQSMDYYLDRPEIMEEVYKIVQDSLNSKIPIPVE